METNHLSIKHNWFYLLKSDRCGMETLYIIVLMVYIFFDLLKSDRCGMETHQHKNINTYKYILKSDRCGMETYL